MNLVETRVGVFDYATFTGFLDDSVGFHANLAVLDIELLQLRTIVRYRYDASVRYCVTRLDAEFAQLWTVLRNHLQYVISDVTLADVQ